MLDLFIKDLLDNYFWFLLTCFSICNCWIVLGGGTEGKNDSFVVFVVVPDVRSPRISKSANGLVPAGAVTGESDRGANIFCCCCGCNGGGGAALAIYGCCWGEIEVAFTRLTSVVWGEKLAKGLDDGGAALGNKFNNGLVVFIEVAGWVVVFVERPPNNSSKG